jgi:chaperonin GroES
MDFPPSTPFVAGNNTDNAVYFDPLLFFQTTMTEITVQRHVRMTSVHKHPMFIWWFFFRTTFSLGSGWVLTSPSNLKPTLSYERNPSKRHFLSSLRMVEVDASDDSKTAPTLTVPSSVPSTITLDGQEIRQPIAAVNNIVIVKVKDALSATGGGILLPDQSKQRPTEGLVVKAGPGKLHPFTGVRITNPVQEGMSVV